MSQPSKTRPRLDVALVEAGLVSTRQRAQALVLAGKVTVDGARAQKPGTRVAREATLALIEPDHPFVSRGGVKLDGALDALGWSVAELCLLDVGASTGGFTDCLLQRGARHVIALDVGYGQLAWSLRQDPRVGVIERTNIRKLTPGTLTPSPEAAVVDLSFISLTLVLPKLCELLPRGARVLALIKPQFEAPRAQVGKGGVVRDAAVRQAAVEKILACARALGCQVDATIESPLPGPKGNIETFIALRTPAAPAPDDPGIDPRSPPVVGTSP